MAACSAVLGLLGGIVLALIRLSRSPVLAAVSSIYVWVFGSIPLIVLLLNLYNFGALYESLSLGIPFGPEFFHFSEADLATPLIIAIVGISTVAQFYVERYFARGAGRTLPPTPLQRVRMAAATLTRRPRWTS
ncbi:hypothetical protein [Gordonia sp. NPDC003950]